MKKRLISVLVLLSCLMGVLAAETSNGRGFYFDVGLGASAMSYGTDLDSMLSSLEKAGANRTSINLGLTLGYALTNKLYIDGEIQGTGDRFTYGSNYMQINSYLYAVGVKLYPFETGLQLGASLGKPSMVVQSNTTTEGGRGDLGLNLAVAYDFAKKTTGSSLIIGVSSTALVFEGDTVSSGNLFFKYAHK